MAPETLPTVLLVDDDPSTTYILRQQLEERFKVLEAYDGYEALALIPKRRPDIAVIDVVMPMMMGWELCQKLKKACAPHTLPVIILTSKTDELDELRSYESEADAYLSKPPQLPILLSTIDKLLKARS